MSSSNQNAQTLKIECPRKRPTDSNEGDDFEDVDLAFTEQELTRKNSFDFVIEEKKMDDEIHDLLYGKSQPPKVAVPAPTASGSREEVRRYGAARHQPEYFEMTDFSRHDDLEAGLEIVSKKLVKQGAPTETCAVM